MKSIRVVVLVLGFLAAALTVAPSAGASGAPTSTTLPGSTAIDTNFAFTGATITSPADPTPRTLNGYQTAVFVQSWFPVAMYGRPDMKNPPANLPVYRVDIMGSWGGTENVQVGNQTVYYASDGTTAFVSYPQFQSFASPTPTNPPPPPTNWFVPPPRTIDAFNGNGQLVETAGVVNGASPRTPVQPQKSNSSSSSTPWVLYGVLAAAVFAIIVGVVMYFRRAPAD